MGWDEVGDHAGNSAESSQRVAVIVHPAFLYTLPLLPWQGSMPTVWGRLPLEILFCIACKLETATEVLRLALVSKQCRCAGVRALVIREYEVLDVVHSVTRAILGAPSVVSL